MQADMEKVTDTAKKLCMHIAAANPLVISRERISKELYDREMEISRAQAAEAGKEGKAAESMIKGRFAKWEKVQFAARSVVLLTVLLFVLLQENVLMEQVFMLDSTGKTSVTKFVADSCPSLTVEDMVRFKLGGL